MYQAGMVSMVVGEKDGVCILRDTVDLSLTKLFLPGRLDPKSMMILVRPDSMTVMHPPIW